MKVNRLKALVVYLRFGFAQGSEDRECPRARRL